ncbi:bile acid:sodium symporter family protein [Thiohalobacter thiocyanaticus]|uniref:Bile acid:sodium symporter family protein n=1 Tax=Thiohalobacter thiocyanaticus TaxID=585455 RepID=A0A426QIJ0_9GAMM|nr:bile acid:sodium symporter family protein [Thiohalobacter thiocyanaticus]RRQ21584.1 bile acid:sodium symporter family protein [Thiohalobacter thiocyanaticus]
MTTHNLTRLFPLWAILFSALAWWQPQLFADHKNAILPLLALVMFGMGLTLTLNDFARILKMPKLIVLGALLQFGVMPLAAWMISLLLGLNPLLTAGMVLVGASPGGTASNVVCYLAKGNVALSITLTAVSTLLAVLLTPWLSWLYLNASIDVPVLKMLKSIVQLIIAPAMLGIALNRFLHARLRPLQHAFPLISVAAIVLIIAIIVALNHTRLSEISLLLLLAVVMHNLTGLFGGYAVPRLLGYDTTVSRTLAIEVGMQNSGLAVALALKYFAPLAALPGALFSIWHNLSGSLLASLWRRSG